MFTKLFTCYVRSALQFKWDDFNQKVTIQEERNGWIWMNGCEWMNGWIYELIKNLMNLMSIIL